MKSRRPATLADIARRVGVSTATVSNALQGKGRLSADLARRIRQAADEVGYVPDHAARALRTGRSRTLGLVVPDFGAPLFPTFAQAIERAAKRRGYAVLIGDAMGTLDGQRAEVSTMIARGADALVLIPMRGSAIPAVPVPIAVIDSAALPENTVASDHRDGGRQVARHLVELGHRRILVLAGPASSTVARERLAGMVEVFSASGVETDIVVSDPALEDGRRIAQTFDPGAFTAIAAAYDTLAIGVLNGLAARGIACPGQVSVSGFDDLVWGRIVAPALTTVRQDLAAIAERAVAFVMGEGVMGAAPADTAAVPIVPVELVVRQSTGPCPEPA